MTTELQTIELTPIQRAEKVLGFSDRKAQLAELADRSAGITEITNRAGFQECHAARVRLKEQRVAIKAVGEEAREDANQFARAVIAKQKELIAVIQPEEDRLQALQDAWEAARAAERAERERIERERVAALRARVQAIRDRALAMVGQPGPVIHAAIDDLRALDLSDLPEDFAQDGAAARAETIDRLVELHSARLEADAAAARVERERTELEERRRAQDEQERLARAEREEQDRLAREQREREEAEHQQRLAAARQQEERERAERQRQEEEARAERERVQRKEDDRLRREREEIERHRAVAAREALEREIAEATLYGAACEAIDFLRDKGFGDELVTQKLAAALGREKPVREAA